MLHAELRRATYRRELALEWYEDVEQSPPSVDMTAELSEDPERVGWRVRTFLGVTFDTQFGWRSPYDALNGWRGAIEGAGALVMQMIDVPSTEARGFSLAEEPLPVACLNIKDAPNGRTFTLLHEFAHIVLRQGGLCDLDDTLSRPPELLAIERFANRVAAATLLPETAILADRLVRDHEPGREWNDQDIQHLGRHFGVSNEAIVRRLMDLRVVSHDFYQRKRDQYHEEYQEYLRNRPPGFAPPAQMAYAAVGPAFASLAIGGYSEGRLTAADVSDALGVRTRQIDRIASMVEQRVA